MNTVETDNVVAPDETTEPQVNNEDEDGGDEMANDDEEEQEEDGKDQQVQKDDAEKDEFNIIPLPPLERKRKRRHVGVFDDLESELTDASWRRALAAEFKKPYWKRLCQRLNDVADQSNAVIYPPRNKIFAALNRCPLDKVRVCIIGQDPYHGPGQAEGMSFSVPMSSKSIPSSLQNIYKELGNDVFAQDKDVGRTKLSHGHLGHWADQGVLLLNATLTVSKGDANSHRDFGWQHFTDAVIDALNARTQPPMAFLLWGSFAQQKGKRVNDKVHCVLKAAHPSGLSADKGFFGCRHFSRANEWLKTHKLPAIDWSVS